ncbi:MULTISPECIES: TraR/DksA family transcriptional regulator [unclassified Limnohabitans]|uniref:TraR/DksA family transcriptional regulator n=1 Tax=unclassified Limnohabitans TaxID=2626134 RepID=UPI001E5E8518|nr:MULTISPECIES: TraR/DksA family transcriptional regulator [unclassified Limnohabitans]
MNTSSSLHQERLLRERAELLKRIAQERGGLVSRVDMAAEHDVRDFENRAQAISERDDEFAMNEHETAELGALDAALERLAAGLYGTCKDCGVSIPEARLAAYPATLRCIDCQTAAEKTH